MKKTITKESENVYSIRYTPSKIERLLKIKERKEKFKAVIGMTYMHSSNNMPFIDEKGVQLSFTDNRMILLNNFIRKEEHFNTKSK